MRPLVLLCCLLPLAFSSPALAQGIDKDKLEELIEKATEGKRKNKKEMRPRAKKKGDKRVAKEMRKLLKRRKVTINFVKTEFTEVLDFLRDITGLNIVLSKEAKKQFGKSPVTLRVKKIKLRSALNLILDQVSKDLRYGVKHGVMWIGLKSEWKKQMITKLYYIGDIITRPPDFPGPKVGLGENGITFDE